MGLFSGEHSSSFFGTKMNNDVTDIEDKYIETIINNLMIHCATNGLFYTLNNHPCGDTSSILSGKYHHYNKKGYFDCNSYDINLHKVSFASEDISQKYNAMYKRLLSNKTNYYSTHILNTICTHDTSDKFYNVSTYKKNIALHILSDKSINQLSKSLLNNTETDSLLKNYAQAFNSCVTEANNLNKFDKYILQFYMEYLFGFSTSMFICDIFDDEASKYIQTNNFNFKLLYNKDFALYMKLTLNCPAILARNTLLEYALFMLANTSDFNRNYLNKERIDYSQYNNRYDQYNFNIPIDTNQLISDASKRFVEFFSVLNNVTIPLLEDLWIVITSELFPNSSFDLIKMYQLFIEPSINDIFNFEADYLKYTRSTRKKLTSILNNTFKNDRFYNQNTSSIPLFPIRNNSYKSWDFLYNNTKNITDYFI